MNAKNMAFVGAGLMVAGIGLGAVGAALILPAVVSLGARAVRKTSERLISEVERGSKVVGAAAGTLQKSFTDAARAGVTQIRATGSGGSKKA